MRGSVTRADVDITVQNNVTWNDAFQFDPPDTYDTDDVPPAWNFTGQNFRLDIKGNPEDATDLLSITSGAGQIVVDDAINRILHMNVPETTLSAALVPGRYFYDLIMYDGSSPAIRQVLMGGRFNYSIGITGG